MKSSAMMQQRKTNFTLRELNALLTSVAKRRRTILGGMSGGQDRWAAAWREVAREVTYVEGIQRTDADVRKKWTYLKWEAKNTSKPYRDFTSQTVLNILTNGNSNGQNRQKSSLFVNTLNGFLYIMDIPRAIVGPQGQKLLFYQGHVYTMKARKGAVNVRWICHHYKLYKCKATINTDNQTHTTVFSAVPHCHPPSEETIVDLEKQIEVRKLARKLLDDDVKPSDLVNESLIYKSMRSKSGQVSVATLKRLLRRDKGRLKKQILEQSETLLNPVTGVFEDPYDSVVPGEPQREPTAVPSTSGIVPMPSANNALFSVPSQPQVNPYVPVQTDVRASAAQPFVPVQSDVRPIPTPPVVRKSPVAPEPNPLSSLEDDSSISVKWNTYATNMSSVMPSLLEDEKFVDVTLACDGKYIKCHKVILGACSPYFEELLSVNPCQHPIILMKDFQFWEIRAIVDFIYCGFVNIPQQKLPKLLHIAEILQIKGLTGTKNGSGSKADDAKPTDSTRDFQSEGGSKLRKRPVLPTMSGSKTSGVPVKRLKSTSNSSCKSSFESHTSDESSNQSDVSQSLNPAMAISLEPSTLLHSVSFKEESSIYGVDDSSECPYRNDEKDTKGDFSQSGQLEPLMLSGSRSIKQEVSEEMYDPTDQEPLDSDSVVS